MDATCRMANGKKASRDAALPARVDACGAGFAGPECFWRETAVVVFGAAK